MLNFSLTKRFGLRSLRGNNPIHEIGTGFTDLAEDIDKLIGLGASDMLQAGVTGESSWLFTASINGAGEVGSTGEVAESVAYLPDPVVTGQLLRTVTPKGSYAKLKPVLPASGKYVSCAIELAPQPEQGGNGPAVVSIHTGVEKATQAEAEAAPPATSTGKIQVRRLVIENNAGTYEIKSQEDIRPGASGVNLTRQSAYENKHTKAELEAGIMLSPIRGAFVAVHCSGKSGETLVAQLTVGGELVAQEQRPASTEVLPTAFLSVIVPPGRTLKAPVLSHVGSVEINVLLL